MGFQASKLQLARGIRLVRNHPHLPIAGHHKEGQGQVKLSGDLFRHIFKILFFFLGEDLGVIAWSEAF